jgi:hypothetical protein
MGVLGSAGTVKFCGLTLFQDVNQEGMNIMLAAETH